MSKTGQTCSSKPSRHCVKDDRGSAPSAFFKIENIPNLEMSISAAGGGLCRGLGVRQMSTVTHPVDEACSDAM